MGRNKRICKIRTWLRLAQAKTLMEKTISYWYNTRSGGSLYTPGNSKYLPFSIHPLVTSQIPIWELCFQQHGCSCGNGCSAFKAKLRIPNPASLPPCELYWSWGKWGASKHTFPTTKRTRRLCQTREPLNFVVIENSLHETGRHQAHPQPSEYPSFHLRTLNLPWRRILCVLLPRLYGQ